MRTSGRCTMGQNRRKPRINGPLNNHCPTSSGVREWASEQTNDHSEVRELNEQCGASEWANEQASGPVPGTPILDCSRPKCSFPSTIASHTTMMQGLNVSMHSLPLSLLPEKWSFLVTNCVYFRCLKHHWFVPYDLISYHIPHHNPVLGRYSTP